MSKQNDSSLRNSFDSSNPELHAALDFVREESDFVGQIEQFEGWPPSIVRYLPDDATNPEYLLADHLLYAMRAALESGDTAAARDAFLALQTRLLHGLAHLADAYQNVARLSAHLERGYDASSWSGTTRWIRQNLQDVRET
jgi:hypothetical protein